MNYYKYYKRLRLDELDIASDEEAEELEFELEVRFGEFTAKDRKTWLQQNVYLEFFSRIGTVTSAAREAGVTVYKAQTWKFDNVLGFTRRLEVADLAFNDRLKEKALRRASDSKAPATLLIELLRAYMPEQFSRNGHKCDTSKSDEILRRFREDARREMEAGHPTLRAIARGATNSPPNDDHYTEVHDYPAEAVRSDGYPPVDPVEVPSHEPTSATRHTGGGRYPGEVPSSPIGPSETRNAPTWPDPHEGSNHDDGNPPLDPEEPSHPSLSPTLGDSHNSNLSPAEGEIHNTNLSPAGGEIQRGGSSRAQRREQLRQQRKAEKKNTFPVVRF